MRLELDEELEYQPGVCNIGPEEQKRRLYGALVGFTFSFLSYVLIIIFGWPDWTKLLLFFPLTGSFVGFYQYTDKFCVAFAAMTKYHMR